MKNRKYVDDAQAFVCTDKVPLDYLKNAYAGLHDLELAVEKGGNV